MTVVAIARNLTTGRFEKLPAAGAELGNAARQALTLTFERNALGQVKTLSLAPHAPQAAQGAFNLGVGARIAIGSFALAGAALLLSHFLDSRDKDAEPVMADPVDPPLVASTGGQWHLVPTADGGYVVAPGPAS